MPKNFNLTELPPNVKKRLLFYFTEQDKNRMRAVSREWPGLVDDMIKASELDYTRPPLYQVLTSFDDEIVKSCVMGNDWLFCLKKNKDEIYRINLQYPQEPTCLIRKVCDIAVLGEYLIVTEQLEGKWIINLITINNETRHTIVIPFSNISHIYLLTLTETRFIGLVRRTNFDKPIILVCTKTQIEKKFFINLGESVQPDADSIVKLTDDIILLKHPFKPLVLYINLKLSICRYLNLTHVLKTNNIRGKLIPYSENSFLLATYPKLLRIFFDAGTASIITTEEIMQGDGFDFRGISKLNEDIIVLKPWLNRVKIIDFNYEIYSHGDEGPQAENAANQYYSYGLLNGYIAFVNSISTGEPPRAKITTIITFAKFHRSISPDYYREAFALLSSYVQKKKIFLLGKPRIKLGEKYAIIAIIGIEGQAKKYQFIDFITSDLLLFAKACQRAGQPLTVVTQNGSRSETNENYIKALVDPLSGKGGGFIINYPAGHTKQFIINFLSYVINN